MKPQEIRRSFIDFFVAKGHTLLPAASLIPDAMSTTLFTIAGMEQFVPVFVGREPPPAPRVVTVQRCLRVAGGKSDIENVGRTGRHGTFLEMLGNFSFGEYYKREAILWAWEYLTLTLRLPADRLYATVYIDDDEAAAIWQREIGLAPGRISRFREENFWDMGPTGPCGPSSEIFYDLGSSMGCGRPDCAVGCPHCDRYIEFWNLVFQQFDRESGGALHPLPRKAIDTGMGFERLCMILAGKTSIFETELYQSIIAALPAPTERSPLPQGEQDVQRRIIADHSRAAVFLAADGVAPSNTDRGYVMRFLMRRALRGGRGLRLPDGFLSTLVDAVTESLADGYPHLRDARAATKAVFAKEEADFDRTLARGESRLAAVIAETKSRGSKQLAGRDIFELHDTYGFPPELTVEIAREKALEADMAGYRAAMEGQRQRARRDAQAKRADVRGVATGTEQPATEFLGYETLNAKARVLALFDGKGASIAALEPGAVGLTLLDSTPFYAERGGQAGDHGVIVRDGASFEVTDTQYQDKSYRRILHRGRMGSGTLRVGDEVEALVDPLWRREVRRHHSATHLLQRALKEALGDAVAQRGSAVYPDHTRFDFDSPSGSLSKEQERRVQARVNELIRADYHLSVASMPFAEAIARGAIYMKGEDYGDVVRVVTFGPSVELCGGTHVESTGEIGLFVLTSESAIAAGIRRVEGVVSESADRYVSTMRNAIEQAGAELTVPVDKLADTVARLARERRDLEKQVASLHAQAVGASAAHHLAFAKNVNGVPYLAVRADDAASVRALSDAIRRQWSSGVLAVAGSDASKVWAVVTVSQDLVARGISAKEVLARMMTFVDGRGGGTPEFAQGGGKKAAGIEAALAAVPDAIRTVHE